MLSDTPFISSEFNCVFIYFIDAKMKRFFNAAFHFYDIAVRRTHGCWCGRSMPSEVFSVVPRKENPALVTGHLPQCPLWSTCLRVVNVLVHIHLQ